MVNDDSDDESVFDQLRDLQYEPTIVDDGIDFDELERLSYEPGAHERHVKALDTRRSSTNVPLSRPR